MEEAPEGNTTDEQSVEYELDDVLLFLLENGIPEVNVYGWHEGWDFNRLEKAFAYFKKRAVEKQRDFTLAVALGASSLLSKEPLEKFLSETESVAPTDKVSNRTSGEIDKLVGFLNGNI